MPALVGLWTDDAPRLVPQAEVANAHRRRRSEEPQSRQLAAAGAASGPIQDPSSWNWRNCARSGVWRRSAPSGFRRPYRPPNVALGGAVAVSLTDLLRVAPRRSGRPQLGGEATCRLGLLGEAVADSRARASAGYLARRVIWWKVELVRSRRVRTVSFLVLQTPMSPLRCQTGKLER